MTRRWRRLVGIWWPSFLGACVLEVLVFAMVDPAHVHAPGGARLDLDVQMIHGVAFFAFWAVGAAVAWTTQRLGEPDYEVNSRALD